MPEELERAEEQLRDQFEDQLPELIDRELESTRDEREEQLAERKLEEMIERLEDPHRSYGLMRRS